jgi:DNA-binding response OmpR family regulator
MEAPFMGRLILIAEDEPLIALEITQAFEDAGAKVVLARTLNEALLGVEDHALSAAILDHALSDGDCSKVCERMKERSIPFVSYSGYDRLQGACHAGVLVKKPVAMSELLAIVGALLPGRLKPDRLP